MRLAGRARRSISLALALALSTALFGLSLSGIALGACGSNLDMSLSQSASPGPGGNIVYTLTVTNFGPSCAHGVRVHVDLRSRFVSFSSSDEWSCPTPPGNTSVDCVLETDLDEGSSSSVAIEAAAPTAANVTARGFAAADSVTDSDPSNNFAWAAFGTWLSTDPQGPKSQATTIVRPDPAGISAQQVSPGSRQGSGVPAPCEPKCLDDLEIIFSTPPTDPTQFPDVHLTVVLAVKWEAVRTSISVYRFDHEADVWLGPLVKCTGFDGDPRVGCVQSIVIDQDVATITVWTSHNGHIRG